MTQMNIPIKQTESGTWRTDWLGRNGVGGWGLQMQVFIYRMDKKQGLTVQHRELYPISYDKTSWKQ